MGKSVFTIIFLIVALAIVTKIQTFVKNNRPEDMPVTPIIDESQTIDLVNPVIYVADPDSDFESATSTMSTSTSQ
jgi:hypothetical protein